jgi:hypothetical protein
MRLTTSALTRAAAWANTHPTTVFAMLMTVLALGPICLLLIGAWTLFLWPSPLKLILLVAFVLVAMLIVAGDGER